jgi:hypothetical protein
LPSWRRKRASLNERKSTIGSAGRDIMTTPQTRNEFMVASDLDAERALSHRAHLEERFNSGEEGISGAHAPEIEHIYPRNQGETYPMQPAAYQGINAP